MAVMSKEEMGATEALDAAGGLPRLPRRIPVGSRSYSIFRDKSVDGENIYATCDYRNEEMRFSPTINARHTARTFLHELVHAVCEEYRLGLAEDDIHRLSNGLVTVLQNLNFYPVELKLPDDP